MSENYISSIIAKLDGNSDKKNSRTTLITQIYTNAVTKMNADAIPKTTNIDRKSKNKTPWYNNEYKTPKRILNQLSKYLNKGPHNLTFLWRTNYTRSYLKPKKDNIMKN